MENILDDDLSCFRIRSARRRLRAQKEDCDKMLLRLGREECMAYREIRSLGWKELKPPVQRGFARLFVLRDDVKRLKEASFFEGILTKINTKQWSHDKHFRKKRRRFGKKIYANREQNLRDVFPDEFVKKFTEKEKHYFYPVLIHVQHCKTPLTVYRFAEPWRFVLRVQPDMITKVRIKDLDREQELARIGKFLSYGRRRERLEKLKTGSTYNWLHRAAEKYESPFRNRSFADILEEYMPQPNITISIRNPRSDEGFLFVCYLTPYCFVLIGAITTSIRRICPRLVKENTPSFREKFKLLWK